MAKFKSEESHSAHLRKDCSYLAKGMSKGRSGNFLLMETVFCTSQQLPQLYFFAVIVGHMCMLA